jgi:hypothetical protein
MYTTYARIARAGRKMVGRPGHEGDVEVVRSRAEDTLCFEIDPVTKPLHGARAPSADILPKTTEEPVSGGTPSAAVLVERFEAKIAGGGVFLTLFGIGVRKEGAPLEHTPALTAYMSGRNATDLSKVLASAVAILNGPRVDQSNPQ